VEGLSGTSQKVTFDGKANKSKFGGEKHGGSKTENRGGKKIQKEET